MANIDIKLGGDLSAALQAYGKAVGDSVLLPGVAAMARPLYDEVKLNASPPRMGQKSGNLEKSIYRAYIPDRSTDTRKTYVVSWNRRTAPHGHLLEFGTSRALARPFLRPAFAHIPEAIKAGKERMAEKLAEGAVPKK